jgi:hypothetical protein
MSVLIKPQTDRRDGILRPVAITPEMAGWHVLAYGAVPWWEGYGGKENIEIIA